MTPVVFLASNHVALIVFMATVGVIGETARRGIAPGTSASFLMLLTILLTFALLFGIRLIKAAREIHNLRGTEALGRDNRWAPRSH
ncbi:hypothetical protein OG943_10795 [Amycolatopsis sp. NBC_00345]|uniref:hypothetical protein n=1 Tax=Amycolatopsis sp. NBC_00345 TaxID=2975955 RepID=UPI002E267938